MGRSGNRKHILLGSKEFSLSNKSPGQSMVIDDNVGSVPVPDTVSDYQLGINIYWQQPREEILSAFAYSHGTDKQIIKYFLDDMEPYNNLLSWANDMAFENELELVFPGEQMTEMPKSKKHALFISTVVDFRIDPLDYSKSVTLEKDTKEILLSLNTLRHKTQAIEDIYGREYLIHILGRYAKPLGGNPLKLAFRNNFSY